MSQSDAPAIIDGRCVRIFPGVNSRAELVTLAPALRAVGSGKMTSFLAIGPATELYTYWSECSYFRQSRKCAQMSGFRPIYQRIGILEIHACSNPSPSFPNIVST